MRQLSFVLLLILSAAPPAFSQATIDTDGAASRVDVEDDRGVIAIQAQGLPANAPLRAFLTTRAPWTSVSAERPSNPGSLFFQVPMLTFPIDGWGNNYTVVGTFVARAADDSVVDLRVRSDTGQVFCQQRSVAGMARCIVRIPHSEIPRDAALGRQRMLLAIDAEARGSRPVQVSVSGFLNDAVSPETALELPSAVTTSGSGTATLALPYSIRTNRTNSLEAFQIAFRDDSGNTYREGTVLLNRKRRNPSANAAIMDMPDADSVWAGTSNADIIEHRKLVFLVPANAGRINVRASASSTFPAGVTHPDGTPQDLALSLHRVGRDPGSSEIPAVPEGHIAQFTADSSGAVPWPQTTSETISLDGQALAPGLWYAVPRSKTGVPLNVNLTVDFGPAVRSLAPQPGHYFNPDRSGHGVILAPAGDDWVLIWYTYDEDGRPTWYYAQAPKPNEHSGGSQWVATLYRNVWDGTKTRFQFAGLVQLAALSTDRLTFMHLLNGRLGAEDMQRLGDGRCTQRHGDAPLDVTGLWYAPTKSGYGYSIEFIGGTEFYLAYAYDAAGMPRWVTAQQAEGSPSVPLWQVRGPCPSCAPMVTTREIVGTLERTIGAGASPDDRAGFLTLGMDASFANGVPGRWKENRPASLLSRRTGCPGG